MPAVAGTEKIILEAQKLTVSPLVELFQLDATALGVPEVLYLHSGVNGATTPLFYGGQQYQPFAIEVKGFEFKVSGELPRPTLRIGNIVKSITILALNYNDLVGARVTRIRTHARFLDKLADGVTTNPDADANAHYPPDVFYIDRKVAEQKTVVEFELGTSLDIDGIMLPLRTVVANLCLWNYRSAECGYAKTTDSVFRDEKDRLPSATMSNWRGEYDPEATYNAGDGVIISVGRFPRVFVAIYPYGAFTGVTTSPPSKLFWFSDVCSKSLAGCRYRFDPTNQNKELPYGGFPGCANMPGQG